MLRVERGSLYDIGAYYERRHLMERSAELQDIILAAFEDYSSDNASAIERHTSRQAEVRLIGTDPDEWFEGEQAAEVLMREAQDPSFRVSFVEGSVGWASGRPTWMLEDGTEIPSRWTAVFHQEDGEWKMVQAHASVGVPDEELFGG
jgi:SnoaL-like domain